MLEWDGKKDLSVAQLELLQAVFDYFVEHGKWPDSREMHVRLRRLGDFWELARSIGWRLIQVGDRYTGPDQASLSIEGTGHCVESGAILQDVLGGLQAAVDEYLQRPAEAMLTFEVLQDKLEAEEQQCKRVCRLLVTLPRGLRGHSIPPDGRITDIKLTPDIVAFENVRSVPELLGMLAAYRRESEAPSRLDVTEPLEPRSGAVDFEALADSVRRLVADPQLRDIAQQDVEELSKAWSVDLWKAACILSGSAMEAILIDALYPDEQWLHTSSGKLRLNALIEEARKHQWISMSREHLMRAVQTIRNTVHPTEAAKEGRIEADVGKVVIGALFCVINALSDRRVNKTT